MRDDAWIVKPADDPIAHVMEARRNIDGTVETVFGPYDILGEIARGGRGSGFRARLRDRHADGIERDLVEQNEVLFLDIQLDARVEDLLQVPGDRLALAVRVGRQIQRA